MLDLQFLLGKCPVAYKMFGPLCKLCGSLGDSGRTAWPGKLTKLFLKTIMFWKELLGD